MTLLLTDAGRASPSSGAAPPSSLLTGLVAYYKLDGNATDSGGSGRDLTPSGATYGAGKIGQCLTGGLASRTPLGGLTAGQPLTVAAWLKPASDFPDTFAGVSFPGAASGVFGDGGGNIALGTFGSAGSSPVVVGVWKLFTAAWNGTDVFGYVNAAELATAPEAPPDVTADEFRLFVGGEGLVSIDEAGVWSRALTPAEVAALYNGGAGLTYPFS